MRVAISGLVFLALMTGCSKSSDSNDGGRGGSDNLSGTYKFESNGCSTGDHAYSSAQEYCQQLQDEVLNKGCAYDLRRAELEQRCSLTAANPPKPPTPMPTPASPAPQLTPPAHATCFKSEDAAPKGTEISLDAFADGSNRNYRMVSMTGMFLINAGSRQMSVKILTTSSTAAEGNIASIVMCKEMSDTPTGNLDGKFKMPKEIRRNGGVIDGEVRTNFQQYGIKSGSTDRVEAYKSNSFDSSTLTQLAARVINDQGDLHIYQMTDGSVQLVISGKTRDNSQTSDTLISAIYREVSTPAATPAEVQPQPASAPIPVPAPGNEGKAIVEKICNDYAYTSDQVNCLLKFKKVSIPKEVKVCNGYTYSADQVACALKLTNKNFSPGIGELCDGFTYPGDQVSCLQKLADIQVSATQVGICSGYTYSSDQMACILKFK